jgi:AraC family transcriptional regulator
MRRAAPAGNICLMAGEDPRTRELRRTLPVTGLSQNVRVGRLVREVDEVSLPGLPEHLVMVNLGRPFKLEERLDGRVYRTSGARGDVAFVPAGTPAEFLALKSEPQPVESITIGLDPDFLRRVAEGSEIDPDGFELVGTLGGRDPEIERVGAALLSEAENDRPFGGLYADALASLLAVHLLRHHSSLGRATAREPGGTLPGAVLRRVTDYVEGNLAEGLTLEDISAVARMSPFHFSRLFKASTGLSPHRYVLERRVERAKGLLAGTGLPLHEVASLCGFADQSHLARHFRRRLGVTPRRFRLGQA